MSSCRPAGVVRWIVAPRALIRQRAPAVMKAKTKLVVSMSAPMTVDPRAWPRTRLTKRIEVPAALFAAVSEAQMMSTEVAAVYARPKSAATARLSAGLVGTRANPTVAAEVAPTVTYQVVLTQCWASQGAKRSAAALPTPKAIHTVADVSTVIPPSSSRSERPYTQRAALPMPKTKAAAIGQLRPRTLDPPVPADPSS